MRASEASSPAPPERRRRCEGVDWARILAKADVSEEELEACLENDSVLTNVYVEWPEWDVETWEVSEKKAQWLPAIVFACRWGTLSTVAKLLREEAELFRSVKGPKGRNLLCVLLSQPPAEVVMEAQPAKFQPALLRNQCWEVTAAETCLGVRSADVLAVNESLARDRENEVALMCHMLIEWGHLDPGERDDLGYNAVDYAHFFRRDLSAAIPRSMAAVHPDVLASRVPQRAPLPVSEAFDANTHCFSTAFLDSDLGESDFPHPASRTRSEASDEEDYFLATPAKGAHKSISFPTTPAPKTRDEPAEFQTPGPVLTTGCPSNIPTGCELTAGVKRRGRRFRKGEELDGDWGTQLQQLSIFCTRPSGDMS